MTGNYAGLKFPMVGGIDLTGTVVSDESGKLAPGTEIVLNSFGVGTDHWGGYCEQARVRPEWCLPLPSGMDHLTCARIGTAGYTAALCVQALIDAGIKPTDGAVIVSGATGGVGSVSVALLSSMGYDVVAMSGKVDNPMLTKLGAGKVVARGDFEEKARPLNRENYAGAVDVAGGNILANILSMTKVIVSILIKTKLSFTKLGPRNRCRMRPGLVNELADNCGAIHSTWRHPARH